MKETDRLLKQLVIPLIILGVQAVAFALNIRHTNEFVQHLISVGLGVLLCRNVQLIIRLVTQYTERVEAYRMERKKEVIEIIKSVKLTPAQIVDAKYVDIE